MRLRLLFLFLVLMGAGLCSLGLPLARGIAADEAQSLHLDRLRDVVRFAGLAQPRAQDQVDDRVLASQLRRYTQVYGIDVALLDPSGRVYAGGLGDAGLSPRVRGPVAAALAGRVGELPGRLWPWDDEPFVVAQPMISDGDVVGAVVSVSAAAGARSRVLNGWATLAGLGALALLAATVLAARMTRWVLRPIRMLEGAAHGIAGGQFETRVASEAGPPELRQLARSFNEMAEHVQAVLAAQRTFVADASHQLRNPLNALLLRLEALRDPAGPGQGAAAGDQGANAADQGAAADLARREGRNLAATLDRMLELARAEHATAEPALVDVAAVVDDRLASWAVLANRRSVRLIREGAASAVGWHDGVALAGAVDAVVDNALKFSPEGGTVRVRVTRTDENWVSAEVTDEGPGMSPGDLAHASERFWIGEQGAGSGTGLGLSIAPALLERHGGRLEVRPGPHGLGLCAQLLVAPEQPEPRAARSAPDSRPLARRWPHRRG